MPRRRWMLLAPVLGILALSVDAEAQIITVPDLTTTTTAAPTTTSSTTTTTSSTTTTTTAGSTTTTTTGATTTSSSSSTTTTTAPAASGGLSITVPEDVDLGSGSTGDGTISGSLGTVTVTDARAGIARSWNARVSTTGFSDGATTIPGSAVSYTTGLASSTGVIVAVPLAAPVSLGSTRTVVSTTGGTGTTSVSWSPGVTITIPTGAGAGEYVGTITHSVG